MMIYNVGFGEARGVVHFDVYAGDEDEAVTEIKAIREDSIPMADLKCSEVNQDGVFQFDDRDVALSFYDGLLALLRK